VPKVVDVAKLIIHPSVEAKISGKHAPLTAEDVRVAVVYGRNISARWEDHENTDFACLSWGPPSRASSSVPT
jgi:hypothetical protein